MPDITDKQIEELRDSLTRDHYAWQSTIDALVPSASHPHRQRNARRLCAELIDRAKDGRQIVARSSRGRSTTGEAAVPYYVGGETTEAAKYLRLTITRWLAQRASMADIDQAIGMLHAARAKETK